MKTATAIRFPEIGDTIVQRYRLESVVAKGGMGIVCLARQLSMDREVAIKMVLPQTADDETTLARFEREVHLAKQLRHPNVVELYDFGRTEGGVLYLVMELLSGQDLKQRLASDGRMSVEAAGHIALQVLDALSVAHERGIVHRDLKPSNVFITRLGRHGDFVKLLDFGIAKSLSKDETELTAAGQMCGTSAYMSPEMFISDALGLTVDVYAMGLLFLEMLVGEKIFQGSTTAENMVLHLKRGVELPAVVRNTPLGHVLTKATSRRPSNRYPSAHEMLEALETALLDTPGDIVLTDEQADATIARVEDEAALLESLLGGPIEDLQGNKADSSDILIIDREMGDSVTSHSEVLKTLQILPDDSGSAAQLPQPSESDVHTLVGETEPEDVSDHTKFGREAPLLDGKKTVEMRPPAEVTGPEPRRELPTRRMDHGTRDTPPDVQPPPRHEPPPMAPVLREAAPAVDAARSETALTKRNPAVVVDDSVDRTEPAPSSTTNRLLIVVPLVALVAMGLAGFVVYQTFQTDDSTPVETSSAGHEQGLGETDPVRDPALAEDQRPLVVAEKDDDIATATDGSTNGAKDSVPAAEPAAELEKTPPEPMPAPIRVELRSKPVGAMAISDDGTKLGLTPLRMKLTPESVPQTVRFELEGYRPQTVDVESISVTNNRLVVEATLDRRPRPTDSTPKKDLDDLLQVERFD